MKVNRARKKNLELRDFSFCFCLGISLAMEPYDRAELVWTMGDLGDVRVCHHGKFATAFELKVGIDLTCALLRYAKMCHTVLCRVLCYLMM